MAPFATPVLSLRCSGVSSSVRALQHRNGRALSNYSYLASIHLDVHAHGRDLAEASTSIRHPQRPAFQSATLRNGFPSPQNSLDKWARFDQRSARPGRKRKRARRIRKVFVGEGPREIAGDGRKATRKWKPIARACEVGSDPGKVRPRMSAIQPPGASLSPVRSDMSMTERG